MTEPAKPTPKKKKPTAKKAGLFYAVLALALTIVALIRFVPFQTPFPFAALESLAFWVLGPAYVLAPIALWRGHRRIAAWLAVIALVHLGWTLEWLPRIEDGSASTPLVRMLDANLLAPRPSEALADEILAADADVLALQEVSHEWLALLDARGARERYPFRVAEPHTLDHDYFGIAILSRRPFVDARIEHLPGVDFCPIARADLEIDGRTVRVYSLHTGPPATAAWGAVWMQQMEWLDARFAEDVAQSDVLIAMGDFNMSPYSFGHRRLRALGLSEAHEAVGRGMAVTWPNGMFPAPAMRLDHAYVHGAAIRSVRELPAHSSDHSPILIELGAL